ncbi:TniQ family protein [Burkholderia ubonensis]|uniref:TniQ family protein n=1 Tax=Burkholderia ubonensis TaxID=101571 RepID=UPI00358E4831
MKLQSLEPIIDAPWGRERIWAYTQRLAEKHCISVGDLVKEVIWPASGWPAQKMRHLRGIDKIGFVDGAGQVAQNWVTVLEKLTGRNDLARLTFLPVANVVRVEGAQRYQGARCIECVREMANQLDCCYDPLSWSLKDYTVCVKHNVLLADQCASCGTTDLAIVRTGSRLGCCGKCCTWMGGVVFNAETPLDSSQYQIAISEAIHDLISIMDDLRLAKVSGTKVLEYVAKLSFDNNFAEMARTIGMPKNTLSVILSRGTKPRIGMLAALSATTGIPVKHMVFGSTTGHRVRSSLIKAPIEKPVQCVKAPRRAMLDLSLAGPELRRTLQGTQKPSLTAVSKKLGTSARSLRRLFPELSSAISGRYMSHQRAKSDAHAERTRKRIFNAFMTLVLANEFPTAHRMAEILGPSACLKQRAFYAATLRRYRLWGKGRAPAPVQISALLTARRTLLEHTLQNSECLKEI